jgi:transketolase
MNAKSEAHERCARYRKRIIEMSQHASAASAIHIAPAFSCIEILDLLYERVMRPHIDICILSKGHAAIAQYVILNERGVLSDEELASYCTRDGALGAHPDSGTPGIEASTGSLGHGLGIACGMAYAERMKRSDVRVYCVLSDGELQEGSTWEAMMLASNTGLSNLIAIVDNNDFTGLDRISSTHPALYRIEAKAHAFDWKVRTANGHDENAMLAELKARERALRPRPFMLIARTIKGKGVSFMENESIWHYRSPNGDEYEQALRELND